MPYKLGGVCFAIACESETCALPDANLAQQIILANMMSYFINVMCCDCPMVLWWSVISCWLMRCGLVETLVNGVTVLVVL